MLTQTDNLSHLHELIEDDFDKTNAFILAQLSTNVPFIKELGEYILQSGGKRLRPIVLLLSAHLFDYHGDDHIPLAAVIEFIHTATLLHDDVVDQSELRRGKKTANSRWGNEASILVGDFLYSRTFQILVKIGNLKAMAILGDATNRLAEGEVIQLLNVAQTELTEEKYFDIIERKTATLFAAATEIGAVLTQQPDAIQQTMKRIGLHIGNAFQLIDDVMDYNSSVTAMGKNPGDDLSKGKLTLPLMHALAVGNKAQSDIIKQAILDPATSQFDAIVAVLHETQALAYAKRRANEQAQLAIDLLTTLPANAYREALMDLASFAVSRES